jgi:orotidine-5'-phosphate decarboxylase
MTFKEKMMSAAKKNNSWLCIGLDPDTQRMPEAFPKNPKGVRDFLFSVVDATADKAACFKPNVAFFESLGLEGLGLLEDVIRRIPKELPVILDAKRADIGNTSAHYAKAAFEILGADAVTVNPYMGFDSIEPFITNPEKAVFILVLTSNKGSADFQQLQVGDEPLYMKVARKAKEWNSKDNIGIVAGATKPQELGRIREVLTKEPFLIPGIGTQGGDLTASCQNCFKYQGTGLFNVSRDILYAGNQDQIRERAEHYRTLIEEARR